MLTADISISFFFFNDTATTEIYTLSLHDALPIYRHRLDGWADGDPYRSGRRNASYRRSDRIEDHLAQAVIERSEEHTSELQSPCNLVCRLLLEKKKKTTKMIPDSRQRNHECAFYY